MRSIAELLYELHRLDIKLWVEGDRLRINAPQGTLTDDLRTELSSRKAEIMDFLRRPAARIADQESLQYTHSAAHTTGNLPASFAQQRLWFLAQLQGPGAAYNIPLALRLRGPLDLPALQQSLAEIVRRHSALRTNFTVVQGLPVQTIAPASAAALPLAMMAPIGLPELHEAAPPAGAQAGTPVEPPPPVAESSGLPARLSSLIHDEVHRPFNLEHDPLLRASLFRLASDDHLLLIVMHHIVSDGWSMGVLADELCAGYNALATGGLPNLPDLPIQYSDYAIWQRQQMKGEALQRQLEYWRGQLASMPPMLELPWDHPRPPVQRFDGAAERFILEADLAQRLQALSQQSGVTLFMLLLAAFAVLLHRYSRQSDFVIGIPVANRNLKQIEPLIGLFVNTLALRMDTSGNPTFLELLRRVRQVALDALDHADLPFEKLVEELQPARSLSHAPLFQVMFAMSAGTVSENAATPVGATGGRPSTDGRPSTGSRPSAAVSEATPSYAMHGLQVDPLQVEIEAAKFDLTLSINAATTAPNPGDQAASPSGLPLSARLEYNTGLFEAATIRRMCAHFQNLLQGILDDPACPIARLPLLSEAEQKRLLYDWNQTQRPNPRRACIHHLFEAQAQKTPSALAVICGDPPPPDRHGDTRRGDWQSPKQSNAHQLTYAELNSRANSLAHYLRAIGVGPEKTVGLCVERSVEMIVGLLGILKAGGAYLPLDPTYPAERLAFILEDARPAAVLAQERILTAIPTLAAHAPELIFLDRDWPAIAAYPGSFAPESPSRPEHLAYVIYTSGSSGKPKGVMIEHRSVVNLWRALAEIVYAPLREMATALHDAQGDALATAQHPPSSHDSLRVSMNASLLFDASVKQWIGLLSGHTLDIIPHEVRLDSESLLDYIQRHRLDVVDVVPSQLKLLLASGLLEEKNWAPRAILAGGEAIDPATWRQISQAPATEFFNLYGPTECTVDACICRVSRHPHRPSIGRPVDNVQVYILDGHLQPTPIGVPGELYIGGDGVGRGYLNRPPRTARTFLPDLFSGRPGAPAGARLYRTGDLARYLPDGSIDFLSRVDNQVKVRGFRIELEDVENALAQHPAIREVAAISREDTPGDRRLAAYFTTSPDSQEAPPSQQELHQFLSEKLPSYMLPSVFVHLEAMPHTPNRKIDRRALPAPEMNCLDVDSAYIPPRDAVEQALAEIWARVLEVPRVGMIDNFFELGGHSLMVTQVLYRIRELFQIDLPLGRLFDHPTVREMSQLIKDSLPRVQLPPVAPSLDDLQKDAYLDANIQVALPRRGFTGTLPPGHPPQTIFLTGATGFVGAFLLHDLLVNTRAEIYCLVRAADAASARQRIIASLQTYDLWQEAFSPRIVPVAGDLAQPSLGLSDAEFRALAREMDSIYHAGAWVNFMLPYEILKPPNVLGTHEILRLAALARLVPVHYLSTLSVFSGPSINPVGANGVRPSTGSDPNDSAASPILESEAPPLGEGLQVGYSQSKWVAENLADQARQRGLPVTIYRIGTVSGSGQSGAWNREAYVYRFIKGCVQLGAYPDMDIAWRLMPVDYLSRALVHLSMQPALRGKTFHLTSPHRLGLAQWVQWLVKSGYNMQAIPYERWQARLVEIAAQSPEHALYPLAPLLLAQRPTTRADELIFDDQNVQTGLAGSGITCPPIDQNLLQTYFETMIRTGFLL
jgi:amino acid adenylation domain-containing protein/thioester reductase-like protein